MSLLFFVLGLVGAIVGIFCFVGAFAEDEPGLLFIALLAGIMSVICLTNSLDIGDRESAARDRNHSALCASFLKDAHTGSDSLYVFKLRNDCLPKTQ